MFRIEPGRKKLQTMRKADVKAILALMAVTFSAAALLMWSLHSPGTEGTETLQAVHKPVRAADSTALAARIQPTALFLADTVGVSTLMDYGLSRSKATGFVHYRDAGKEFRSWSDVRGTYGWTEADVRLLRPYMRFASSSPSAARVPSVPRTGRPWPESHGERSVRQRADKFTAFTKVDLNTADTTLLKRVPGIGSYYAMRIVSLRQRYGGFVRVDQLSQIPNLPPDAVEWFEADTSHVVKIDLARPDFGQMARHPLIGYERTRQLVRFIRTHGPIRSLEQLQGTGLFTPHELELLAPYLQAAP